MYIDTHLDSFYNMVASKREFSTLQEKGHVDLPRARKGELLAGFFTGFPNCTYFFGPENRNGKEYEMTRPDYTDADLTEEYLANWIKIVFNPQNGLKQLKSLKELEDHISTYNPNDQNQQIGAIMHFEGAAGIDESLHKLYIFHAAGLRSIGLTWNETNQFATGVPGDVNRGLTSAGKDLLDAMQSLGILIDVSHLNDKSFWDVHSNSNKPIFASHSNVRKRAGHMRNLTDEMIKAIAESGGTIGMNFADIFLSSDKDYKVSKTDIFDMVREIINLTGSTDHVHIGSDFDGAKVPEDIKDISSMPDFFIKLQEYLDLTNEDIEKIKYKNMVRLIKNYWK